MTDSLIFSVPSERVAQIQLHRPTAYNALNTEMLCGIGDKLAEYDGDPTIGCVVITGDEKAFAAGADVTELTKIHTGGYPEQERAVAWGQLRSFSKPLIAAVNGFAFGGGCELAMHADIIVASNTAQFAQPEVKLGIMPGAGGTQLLTRRVGKAAAMLMNLTGSKVDAQRALQMGLVSEVADADDALPRALELASRIASLPSSALGSIKNSVLQSYELGQTEGLALERSLFLKQVRSEDGMEGVTAFLEKRKANFN